MTSPDQPLVASASQTIGPFFHVALGSTDRLGCLAPPETDGQRIHLRVRVVDGDGAPVTDALVELWQANASGTYVSAPDPEAPAPAFAGFGRLATRDDGWCVFETIRPGPVAGTDGTRQAPHVNVCVFARGLLRHLHTRAYFEGDPLLAGDALLSLVPDDRRATLLARGGADGAAWEFVVRLQGQDETVFFDV